MRNVAKLVKVPTPKYKVGKGLTVTQAKTLLEAAKKVLQVQHAALVNYISAISSPDRLADLLDREWRGPVPHTVVIAPGGKIVYRSDGDIKPLEVRNAIVEQLGRTYANRVQK